MNQLIFLCLTTLIFTCSIPANCQLSDLLMEHTNIDDIYDWGTQFVCSKINCCNSGIKDNIGGLADDIAEKLYGQHLVQKTVVRHIKGHLKSSDPPKKALALLFCGSTGVGKTYVSRFVAENLYNGGLRHSNVHLLSGTRDYPHASKLTLYKDQLQSKIEESVKWCRRSLFIFDEVDKMPSSLLDVLKPYLDYNEQVGGIDYRNVIFIFLSNTGGSQIQEHLLQHFKAGRKREDLQLRDVESLLKSAANNTNTDVTHGLYGSQLISSSLITAFVPFLPLEEEHVRKCIMDSLIEKHFYRERSNIPQSIVNEVLAELHFDKVSYKIAFSENGCKRVAEKVTYVMVE